MRLRTLAVILFAFAMVFAPLIGSSGSTMAMAPFAKHHGQTTETRDCGDQRADDDHDKSPEKSCCIGMCAAVAIASSSFVDQRVFPRSDEPVSLVQLARSFLAELPTPPPRLA